MRVLGIDPGLAELGWGVIEKEHSSKLTCIGYGCFKTSADLPLSERLYQLYENLLGILKTYQPTCAGVEELFFAKNVSSALPVAHARGVVLLALRQNACMPYTLTPNEIKQAVTGSGAANKESVQKMTQLLLNLQKIPKPNHAADALACAIGLIHGGHYVQ